MKQIEKCALVAVSVACAFVSSSGLARTDSCKPATPAELDAAIKSQKISHLVFFASWCSACKKDLEHQYEKPIFIASFDTLDAASKAYTSIASNRRKNVFIRHGQQDREIEKNIGVAGNH